MAWCPTCNFNHAHGRTVKDRCIECWKAKAEELERRLRRIRNIPPKIPDSRLTPCCIP